MNTLLEKTKMVGLGQDTLLLKPDNTSVEIFKTKPFEGHLVSAGNCIKRLVHVILHELNLRCGTDPVARDEDSICNE